MTSTGRSPASSGLLRDITESRRIEAALRESETRFRRIMTNLLDFVAQVTTEGIYEYVSPSSLALLGYSPDQMLGTSIFSIVHPDDINGGVIQFTKVVQHGELRARRISLPSCRWTIHLVRSRWDCTRG